MAPEDAFIEQCKDVFASFDLDGNGRITPYIIGQVMKNFGWTTIQHYELVVRPLTGVKYKFGWFKNYYERSFN